MEQTPEIIETLQNTILEPNFSGAMWLAIIAFLGEVVAPFPSSLFFAGQLLFLEDAMSITLFVKLLLFVAIPMSIGTTLGSFVSYGIAYIGGKPAIEKSKKYIRFSWEDVEKFESKFKDKWYDEILFFVLRAIPLTPTIPVNLIAGLLRMNPVRYTLLTLVGTTIRMAIMLVIFGTGGGSILIDVLNL
ncbi:MAG: DedA family protein [Minisyncoccota bacterium]